MDYQILNKSPDVGAAVVPHVRNADGTVSPVGTGAGAAGVPVTPSGSAPVGGGITWGAYTSVSLIGSSQTLVAANPVRKAIRLINPGSAVAAYNLAGGTAAFTHDTLQPGQKDWYEGADCPVGAITAIGTSGQTITYCEGT